MNVGGRERRFQINPGPLRVTGERVKEDYDAGRCKAMLRDGSGRCLRDAVVDGYCRQHSKGRTR